MGTIFQTNESNGNTIITGSLTITPTTNQLILGTTNTTTIDSVAPSASRLITIPDAGSSSNMVLDQGNYTIGGTWTFGNSITLASSKAVIFTDNTTHTVTMQATNSTTSWTLKLPTTSGSNNFFLQTDGSGNTTWASGGSGTVGSGTSGQIAVYNGSTSVTSGVTASMNNTKLTSLSNGTASTDAVAFGQVTPLFAYRRPTLVFSSATVVSVETGLDGTSGDAVILFPDGQLRTETSTNRYNGFITQNAVFNNAALGSNQGGLRTGSVAANTWYACYAVKVTTFAANWVMVLDTVLPKQSNYSTLNTNFGTNGWIYLGLIRYGDQGGSSTGILDFNAAGNQMTLTNANSGVAVSGNRNGILLATTAGASSLSWAYASGTSGAVLPNNINIAVTVWDFQSSTNSYLANSGNNYRYIQLTCNSLGGSQVVSDPTAGYQITNASSTACDILIVGWFDNALGIGPNPLL